MLYRTYLDDAHVAALDPLDADSMLRHVPHLNANADVAGLASVLRTLCERARLEFRSYSEVLAIVRDIGLVAGSINRHGVAPKSCLPELEPLLLRAGALTDLPPRDTLMHYTIWNPAGNRVRTYTNHEQEPHLIESIRRSFPAIRDATRRLFALHDASLVDAQTVRRAFVIADNLKSFLAGLNYAKHHVTPETFISSFRPYFEPFSLGESTVRGPGAVTMPLHIFDFILWGSSERDGRYQSFTSDYVPYNTPEFREYYLRARNTPSFVDRLESAARDVAHPRVNRRLLLATKIWFKRIHGFRGAHYRYAIDAYHGKVAHGFTTGSGGHTTSDLRLIARLTEEPSERVDKLLQEGI